ncbi:response regulator [Thalassospira sp.]|uniref:DNA-binding response regulator n=1 Tax=Thalassospira sp. TaxID=1912094 RepID=UPI000C61668A|nr:response regulator [Thalassospira sp.]MBC08356.1 DNA-binding response regulator [Thalassospira sp.]|tara:strand:+ start:1620 stop:2588 length:969 start_codon:yes stop_codon:yes gene_type:complete
MTAKKTVRIAFVDDDENLLSSHRRNFGRLRPDWEGVFLNDPIAARDAIIADADISAVILDIHMPGMTGLELAAELRTARKDLLILMLTGYADLQSALLAVNELGVFRFYPKPTLLETMLDDIDTEIKSRLGQSEDTLPTEFLDLFELGVIAVDENLNILHLNSQGADVLRRSSLVKSGSQGRLIIDPTPEGLAGFLTPPGKTVPRSHQSFSLERDGEKLSLLIRRVPKKADGKQSFMIILVDPAQQRAPAIDDLMDLFGLTRSEAKLTQKLAEGLALDQAAELVGISHSSARTYLKTIFSKTGVNRQPQLMKTVLSSIPSLR